MRKAISFIIFLFFISSQAQVQWMSFADAVTAQKTHPKKILIDFYADWCGPCKLMDKKTYDRPEIASYINENFYPVKFNSEGNENVDYLGKIFTNPNFKDKAKKNSMNEFTVFMNVSSVPSTVFLDENSYPITNLNGYLSAKELEPYLMMISTNDYKKVKTKEDWDNYQRKLKSNLKE